MARKAHKVPIGELEICGIPDRWPAPPFLMRDTASILNRTILIFERSVDAWRGVAYFIATDTVEDVVVEDHECYWQLSRAKRYYPWEHNINQTNGEPVDFVTHRQALRTTALQKGATPEAIRLLHADKAFTKQEVKQMADKKNEKLAKKAPKADKAGGGDGAAAPAKKSKGNPEALKKAREAAAERGPDVRKITVLKKENPYREGSNRAASFDALKGAKTVDDYKTAGGAVKYISRWESEGIIKLA
jgi:hypothetical protein